MLRKRSGENDKDRLLRGCKNLWLLKANSLITTYNQRKRNKGQAHLCKPNAKIDQAPDNLLERNTIYPDAVMYKLHGKSVIIQVEKATVKKKPSSTSSPSSSNRTPPKLTGWKDTSISILDSSDEDEEKRDEENKVAERFTSRFAQRKAENKIKHKNLTSATRSAKIKAEAFQANGVAAVASSRIDAIKTAYTMGMPPERLFNYLDGTLEDLFNKNMIPRAATSQNIVVASGKESEKGKEGQNKKKRAYPEVIELDPTPEQRKAAHMKRLAMWDAYEKQRETYEYYARGKPSNEVYCTPPPSFERFVERNGVLTQYSASSSAASTEVPSKPNTPEEDSKIPAKPEPDSKSTGIPSPQKKGIERNPIYFDWKCASDNLCKKKIRPESRVPGNVSCTLMCPICRGYVHLACAVFDCEPYPDEPVCFICFENKKKRDAEEQQKKG